MKTKTLLLLLCIGLISLTYSSCATVGRDFPEQHVTQIEIGKTNQEDIRKLFGPPWRTGIEDGMVTWEYGTYQYQLFGNSTGQDLVVRFDENGTVVSYSYSAPYSESR